MHDIGEAIEEYRRYLVLEKGLSKNTLMAYMLDLEKLEVFIREHELDFKAITLSDLEQFLAHLNDQPISPRSVMRILSGIKSFFRFLLIEGEIENNPSELLESPRVGLKLPVVLSVAEIDRMLAAIDVSTMEGTRNYAIIETLYSCGLRVSELINLRFSDLFFDEKFIRVQGKGNKQRLVPISDTAIDKIKNYLHYRNKMDVVKGNEDIVFLSSRGRGAGAGISRTMVFNFIKNYSHTAGIKKKVSPHVLRHSFATHLLERGANIRIIQEMMGHEKITTTEIYTHIDRNFLRQEIIEHHPRNKK